MKDERRGRNPEKEPSVASDIGVILGVIVVLGGIIIFLGWGFIRQFLPRGASADKPVVTAPAVVPGVTTTTGVSHATPTTQPPAPAIKPPDKPSPQAVASSALAATTTTTTTTTVPPPVPVPPAMSTLDVIRDGAAVREAADLTVDGFDLRQVRVTVRTVRSAVDVDVPFGARLRPQGATNAPCFVVLAGTRISLRPDAPAAVPVFVPVAGLDFHGVFAPLTGVVFEFSPPPQPDPLSNFLAAAAARTSAWSTVQAGVWALQNNISRLELNAIQLRYADPAAPGGARQEGIASYADVKQVEALLSSLGRNPDDCRVIIEEREERARLVGQMNFEKPGPGYLGLLKGRSLTRYPEDSEVEKLLCQYAAYHRRADARRAALESLLITGRLGTPDQLSVRMVSDSDPGLRLSSAMTLLRGGDSRALPVAAALADDPLLSSLCGSVVESAIRAKTKEDRNPGEAMLAYWMRAAGWSTVNAPAHELDNLKHAVEALSIKPGPELTQALADMVSADDNKAMAAIRELTRYPRSLPAFDAVCRTIGQQRSSQVRLQALSALGTFRDMNPARVLEQLVKEGDDTLALGAINTAGTLQYTGFENALLLGLQHRSAGVRRQAADQLGGARAIETEREVARVAEYDANLTVRETALRSLSAMRSPESLRICQSLLRAGERTGKYRAFSALSLWEGEAPALDLLRKYLSDPDLGPQIKNHLSRYEK